MLGKRLCRYFSLLIALACSPALAAPSIGSLSDNTSSYSNGVVPKYKKYELTFSISNVGTAFTDYNPFNPNTNALGSQYYNKRGILVDGILTAPNGSSITHPAFWYDSGVWKFRFAPTMAGTWKVKIRAQDSSGTGYSSERTFQVTDQTTSHGFVRINPTDGRFFEFSDGTLFHPIGCGMSGYSGGYSGAVWDVAFPRMASNGANYTRFFFTSLNIEPYNVGSDKAATKALNNYSISRAKSIDSMFECAEENGVHVEWLLDDWTYLKDASNQYIRTSGRDAPCADVNEFFSLSSAREIYKRKLRYWLARWGYSTSFMCLEFVNELGGATSYSPGWHTDMGKYVQSYTWQPHLASSSNGSGEIRTGGGIPWTDPAMDYVNYHDYAKYTLSWSGLKSSYQMETLGSSLEYPWMDSAVWADRMSRIHFKRYKWNKPLSFTEFGLIYRYPGYTGGFPDWSEAYKDDVSARHVKDSIWAGMLAGMSITHWKLDYLLGKYGGGEKFWVYKPLANFVKGEDFKGLVQETTYSVSDPINSSPKVACSNGKVMAVTMHGPNRAYIYAKNLTDIWFQCVSPTGYTIDPLPSKAAQSATIKVYGMTPGQYIVEKWSTTDTNQSTQVTSSSNITVGSDGIATVSVTNMAVDVGIKIKQNAPSSGTPDVALSLNADKSSAAPGETVIYTITYRNTGTEPASSVAISAPVPADTTYVTASSGGIHLSPIRRVTWTIPLVAAGGSGTVTYQVRIN